jgi:hypothetical protein
LSVDANATPEMVAPKSTATTITFPAVAPPIFECERALVLDKLRASISMTNGYSV